MTIQILSRGLLILRRKKLSTYLKWSGLKQKATASTSASSKSKSSEASITERLVTNVNDAHSRWGPNIFDIPVPDFWELYKEQMLAPFFVFQLFCVLLWCMDEYWYYSLFTLFMLLVFESTVSKSRQRTLEELRSLRPKPISVAVYRGSKWDRISSTELCPGDIISIGSKTKSALLVSSNAKDREADNEPSSLVPADVILLSGSCIVNEAMLTGESTPQWKSSIEERNLDDVLNFKVDKLHVLFGGTDILQHTAGVVSNDVSGCRIKSPEGGCIACVLRTGFATSQGDMMRTILFSTERVTANTWEAGLFILFLMLWAFLAAGYVLNEGLKDSRRSVYKLSLSCILIITSVIPPELPMELSIAVNTSLLSLARARIFCTEPFRIPFAGKVDVCCFDKTGTLTSDNMKLRGLAGCIEENLLKLVEKVVDLPEMSVVVLAACQSLVLIDGKVLGDPIEKAGLEVSGWHISANDTISRNVPPSTSASQSKKQRISILQRHHFSSSFKRMSVIIKYETVDATSGGTSKVLVVSKGAPEVILPRVMQTNLAELQKAYKYYASQGARVLALAYKELDASLTSSNIRELTRMEVESNLVFGGFAIFGCPIKPQSAPALNILRKSSHALVMITGDAPLTACHVAKDLKMTTRQVVILNCEKGNSLNWISPDESIEFAYDGKNIKNVWQQYDICVSGDALTFILKHRSRIELKSLIKGTQVYARVAPDQKELIVKSLRDAGRYVLMCGDGTNDVGGLKAAHIGVALLSVVSSDGKKPEPKKVDPRRAELEKKLEELKKMRSQISRKAGKGDAPDIKLPEWLTNMEEEMDAEPQLVRPGDASLASPFTAKTTNIMPCIDIIRQGRCTLVTTLQTYKILGLNCLATAYVLSVQYLDGVKLGDTQATISGIISASFFLFISRSKPLKELSAVRPHTTIFSAYAFISLLGQFAVHITFLILSVKLAEAYAPGSKKPDPDTGFEPNLVNTVSYTTNMIIQIATFGVNYIGHPFNDALRENKALYNSLWYSAAFFAVLSLDVCRPLNDYLQLVPLPDGFRRPLLLMAVCDISAVYTIEHGLRWLLPPPKTKRLNESG